MKEQSELKKPPYNCPSDGKCHYPECGCQWYLGTPILTVPATTKLKPNHEIDFTKLEELMSEHGLNLLQGEIEEIVDMVNEIQFKPATAPIDPAIKTAQFLISGFSETPVEVKTAEEILEDHLSSDYVISTRAKRIAIECMHAFHAQFNPTPTEDKGIEGVKEDFYWKDFDEKYKCLVDNIHLAVKNIGWKDFYYQVLKYQDKMVDSGYKLIDGCSDDYRKLFRQSHQGKEAETIRELKDLISHLAEYCPIYEEEYWSKIRVAIKIKEE